MNYSYKKTLGKMLKYGLIFLATSLPLLLVVIPPEVKEMSILDILGYFLPVLGTTTLGAVIVGILNWAKWNLAVK